MAGVDHATGGAAEFAHDARFVGRHGHFHLHGLKDHEALTGGHALPGFDIDAPHAGRDRRTNGVAAGRNDAFGGFGNRFGKCDKAVSTGVKNAMLNSGQTCSAWSRMIVPRAKMDDARPDE